MTITAGMLSSSTAAEPGTGETAWSSATDYTIGQTAYLASTHRRYERLAPGGVDAASPETAPTKWKDVGATNRWAMFDITSSAQTVVTGGPLTVTLAPGKRITSVGLRGLYGASVTVSQHVGATETFSKTWNLLLRNTTTWRQYFFGDFLMRPAVVTFDVPMDSSATVTITVQPYAGEARCGGVWIGTDEDVGMIIDQPASEVLNFSKVDRDEFGTATLVRRRNVPVLNYRVLAEASQLDRLRDLRDRIDAVPALWSGSDDRAESTFFNALLLGGIAKKFSITLHSPTHLLVELQLEEI